MDRTPTVATRAEQLDLCLRDVQFCLPLCSGIFLRMGILLNRLKNDTEEYDFLQLPIADLESQIEAVCKIIDTKQWEAEHPAYKQALSSAAELRKLIRVQELN